MNKSQDYERDLAEIRSMMERSSRFLSLSGWAGILAGIYALAGAYIAHAVLSFRTLEIVSDTKGAAAADLLNVIMLAIGVLVLSISTAIFLSYRRARINATPIWNSTSRRLIASMIMPLASGGILILVFISLGLIGLLAPLSLLFYGLALYNAGNYTYRELRYLGIIFAVLGLVAACRMEYGLLLWAVGFGLMHIIYGIYIHVKYER
jgi:predicted lysophospholipase L1 biosynthesis ABC-type transport system permease subunit